MGLELQPSRTIFTPAIENKVVVVGSGLAGSTAALQLKKLGQKVILYERSKAPGYFGPQKAEMTFQHVIDLLATPETITTSITRAIFMSLDDPKRRFDFTISTNHNPQNSISVAINHDILMENLHKQIERSGIIFERGRIVKSLVEIDGGVEVEMEKGEKIYVKAVVDATGPGWNSLPFSDPHRQKEYQDSIVCMAYGHRCVGKIKFENGDKTMIYPLSVTGSGRVSWVNACGVDSQGRPLIELVFGEYSTRSGVAKIDREAGYKLLKQRLIDMNLITIEEDGPIISGYFSLQPAKNVGNDRHIFRFGEKAQFSAATVGDAISPTVLLSEVLAESIAEGKTAQDFFRKSQKLFNHRLEMAVVKTRLESSSVGDGFDIFNLVKWLPENQQAKAIRTHKIPAYLIPLLVIRYPHLIPVFLTLAKNYIRN